MKINQNAIRFFVLVILLSAAAQITSAAETNNLNSLFNEVFASIHKPAKISTIKPAAENDKIIATAPPMAHASRIFAQASASASIEAQIKQLKAQANHNNRLAQQYQLLLKNFVSIKNTMLSVCERQIQKNNKATERYGITVTKRTDKALKCLFTTTQRLKNELAAKAKELDALIEYQQEQKMLEPARANRINSEIKRLNNLKDRLYQLYSSRDKAIKNQMAALAENAKTKIAARKQSTTDANKALAKSITQHRSEISNCTDTINKTLKKLAKLTKSFIKTIKQLKDKLKDDSGDIAEQPDKNRLSGQLKCLELAADTQKAPLTDENLTFSVENLTYVSYVDNSQYSNKVDPATVIEWTWKSDAGDFDERHSLESSLPVNQKIWRTPANPGWYTVECGVDVFGDDKLTATFTQRLYIGTRHVTPPPATYSLRITGQNPIPGELTATYNVEFKQVFVAETTFNGDLNWQSSPGTITGKGKLATWSFICPIDAIPEVVSISCQSNFNGTSSKVSTDFTLSRKVAETEKDSAIAAKNCDPQKILGFLKNLGIEIDNATDPSVNNGLPSLWTAEQLYYTWRAILSLPRNFIEPLKQIKRVAAHPENPYAMGYVYSGIPRVYICNSAITSDNLEYTLIHEIAHVWYFAKENQEVRKSWESTFWSNGKLAANITETPVSSYGRTNVYEDFSEALACYWQYGKSMEARYPKRYAFLKNYVLNAEYEGERKIISKGNLKD